MTSKKIKGIYVRGNTFWLTHGSGERRLQVSLGTTDYAEAVANAQEILNQPLLNTTEGFKPDLDDFADEQVKAGRWTKKSRKSKYSVLLMFGEDIDWAPLPEITTAICQKWYDLQTKRIAIVTANSYVMNIKSFLNWAVEKEIIAKNPSDGVKLVKVLKAARQRFCSFEERDKIINEAPTDELKFILFCGFYAGFRKNEIVEACPDWFDMKLRHVHVKTTQTFLAKDKEERTIPMADEFYLFLKKYGLREPFMIQPKVTHGKSDYRYNFRKPFDNYLTSHNLEWVTPHVMRHTFASLLASQGCSLYKIAKWLGDSERTTAAHYAHLLPSDPDIEMLNGKGDTRKTAIPKAAEPKTKPS